MRTLGEKFGLLEASVTNPSVGYVRSGKAPTEKVAREYIYQIGGSGSVRYFYLG